MTLSDALESLSDILLRGKEEVIINQAQKRLVAGGKWRGLLDALTLRVYEEGTITLPNDYETAIAASTKGAPRILHDPWFEFAPRLSGFIPDARFTPRDLGDGFCTFRDTLGADALRVISNAADESKTFSLSVRRTGDQGVRMETDSLIAVSFQDGSSPLLEGMIDSVISFQKSRTIHPVSLEARVDGAWTEIGRYSARDTDDISLRRYFIPGVKESDVVRVLAKKRFREAKEESDELIIDSDYALRMAILALNFEAQGEARRAADYWLIARKSLDEDLSEHRGSAGRTVPVMNRAFGGAKLRPIR